MLLTDEAWRLSLPPSPFDDRWMGALPLPDDPRDYHLEKMPGVREMLELGFPSEFTLQPFIKGPAMNQGHVPSCVAYSTAHMKSIQDQIEHGQWWPYNANLMYSEAHGTGSNGVDTRLVLQNTISPGAPRQSDGKRLKVGSFAFAPQAIGQFESTLKAAIAARKPCVIALLLPPDLGWNSGTGVSQGYHQMCLVGYDQTYAIFMNSWGPSWGQGGMCRVPWAQMTQNGFQGRYCYAYSVDDAADDELAPPTPPVPTPDPPIPTPNPPVSEWEKEIIRLVNAHRATMNLVILKEHPQLMASSGAKSKDMGLNSYFAHEHNGKEPLTWIKEAGLNNPTVWGENIAAGQMDPSGGSSSTGFIASAYRADKTGQETTWPSSSELWSPTQTPAGAFTAWMNSPGHRANIEFPGYSHIGVGYEEVIPSPYGKYWCQHFVGIAGPGPEPEPPIPTPEPPVTWPTVTGYSKSRVRPGESFQLYGTGFAASRPIHVTWFGEVLASVRVSNTELTVTAGTTEGESVTNVYVGTAGAMGPTLIISSQSGPEPPIPTPEPPIPPIPTPEPEPTAVPLTGLARGGGLEFLKPGLILQASGGGYGGAVTLVTVTPPTPTPTPPIPTPEPEPEPPNPGPLPVRVVGRRRSGSQKLSIWGYVSLPPEATSATVQGLVNGQALPPQNTGPNGIATWSVTAAAPATVLLTASAQEVQGSGTWTEGA